MKTLTKTGRIIFGLTFIIFGLFHFVAGSAITGMVPSWMPGGVFWVYITGLALLSGGVSIIIDKLTFWAGIGLAVMMLIFIATIHLPMAIAGGEMAKFAMPSIMKDLSMAGAALYIAGLSRPQNF